MPKTKLSLCLLVCASLAHTTLLAEQAAGTKESSSEQTEEEPKLSGSAELGYIVTSGNSETSSLNAKLGLDWEEETWKNSFSFEDLRTKATDQETGVENTTADRIIISDQFDYKFGRRSYFFGAVEYDSDDVSDAYDYFYNATVGYGNTLIKEKNMKLALSVGAGTRKTVFDDDTEGRETIGRLKLDYMWKITPSTKLTQMLKSDIGLNASGNAKKQTITRSETSLIVKINSKFAMKTSYLVDHRSEVAEGSENTDSKLAITLVYSI